jgi:hypothetical protein
MKRAYTKNLLLQSSSVDLLPDLQELPRISVMKRIFIVVFAVSLIAASVAVCLRYRMLVSLNNLCQDLASARVVLIGHQYPDWPELSHIEKAGHLYLKSYLLSLGLAGRGQTNSAACEKEADSLLAPGEFEPCVKQLNERAWFCEYLLDLPFLAEACQRCAVSQCRRHADAAKVRYKKTPDTAQRAELRASYIMLANQTEELAKLFCLHEKLELADRGYQDAIASATFANNLDAGHVTTPAALSAAVQVSAPAAQSASLPTPDSLERYYLAYVAFLYTCERDEEALSTLFKMNALCAGAKPPLE